VTSFLYDADGTRLVRHDSKGTTLYLDGTELRWAGGAASVTRYYSMGGDSVGIRTADTDVTWTLTDPHNTALVAVDANDTSQVSRRYQMPFGSDRGAAGVFPGDHGFVGEVHYPEGTVHLGA
jgi:hypothetical protein